MTWCDTQTTLNGFKVNVIHLLIEKQYYDRCSLEKTTMYNYLWFLQNRIFNHITYTYFSNDWVIAWLFLQMHMMIRFSLFYLYVPNTYIVDTDLGSTQIRKQVKLLVSIIGINVLVILGIQGVSYVITEFSTKNLNHAKKKYGNGFFCVVFRIEIYVTACGIVKIQMQVFNSY